MLDARSAVRIEAVLALRGAGERVVSERAGAVSAALVVVAGAGAEVVVTSGSTMVGAGAEAAGGAALVVVGAVTGEAVVSGMAGAAVTGGTWIVGAAS